MPNPWVEKYKTAGETLRLTVGSANSERKASSDPAFPVWNPFFIGKFVDAVKPAKKIFPEESVAIALGLSLLLPPT
jgi:hypothetical protein